MPGTHPRPDRNGGYHIPVAPFHGVISGVCFVLDSRILADFPGPIRAVTTSVEVSGGAPIVESLPRPRVAGYSTKCSGSCNLKLSRVYSGQWAIQLETSMVVNYSDTHKAVADIVAEAEPGISNEEPRFERPGFNGLSR